MDTTAILILLLLPLDAAMPVPCEADAATWQTLRTVAYLLDIWPINGHWSPNFADEMTWTRGMFHQLKDAPPIGDAERFPSYEYADACLLFNAEHQTYLEVNQWASGWNGDGFREALGEAKRREAIWRTVKAVNDK